VFFHTEDSDLHFVYRFCDDNAQAAWKNTEFPEQWIPSNVGFSFVHQVIRNVDCLPSVCVQCEREVVPEINARENILGMVQRSPKLSTRRTASRSGVSCKQVWQSLREEDTHPYHDREVQQLEPRDLAQRLDLCYWITAHLQLLSVILFTHEASFTTDDINNSQNSLRVPMAIHVKQE
jgi:hypothetical protein